jgi:hypothetical protein
MAAKASTGPAKKVAKSTAGAGAQKFRLKLEGVAGSAAFHVPFDVEEVFGTRARVPVCGTINGFPYRSSIMNMGDGHMMVVNREMRAGANVQAGDVVEVVMARDTAERIIEAPADLKKALAADKRAREFFDTLSYTHRKEYVRWITGAKRAETRADRVAKTIKMLNQGIKTPD